MKKIFYSIHIRMILNLLIASFINLNLEANTIVKKPNNTVLQHSKQLSNFNKDKKLNHDPSYEPSSASYKKPINKDLIKNFTQAVDEVFLQDKNKAKDHIEKAIAAFKKLRTATKTYALTQEQAQQIRTSSKKLFGSMTKKKAIEYNIE